MNVIKKIMLLSLAALILDGCASGPVYDQYASSIPPLAKGYSRIYIYRVAIVGAAVQPGVRVNDEVVGKAQPKGFFYVDRPAGDYQISASTEAKRSLSLRLEAGDQKYVRLEMKMGVFAGHVKPVLVDTIVGRREIKKTKYIGK